ncbi:Gfo/Idh/MocA family oxidoreductase [candidate division KSB1 bacterium]|nr:Gfo/Idh/MocA family oxidoreductase [candidate division KSB1 bacterium]
MKNFALVGIGNYANHYLKILQKLEKEKIANLFCVFIRNREKYEDRIKELDQKGIVVYTSFERMLSYGQGKVDIVALPIASMDHAEFTHQAMASGYDVVLERPVAITIQDVDDLIQLQDETGRYCIVDNEFLYSSSINLLCNEMSSGRLGKIKRIRTMGSWPADENYFKRNDWAGRLIANGKWNLDGPATNQCAAVLHNALYLVETVCGNAARIDTVQAELYRAYHIESYDTAAIRVLLMDGTQIFYVASYAVDNPIEPTMLIECENGEVLWNSEDEKTIIKFSNGRKKIFRERHVDQKYESVFRDAITVNTTRSRHPSSTIKMARTHVLVLNLAFESAAGIGAIPAEFLYEQRSKTGVRVCIQNMESILNQAFNETKLFSELNLPWARPTSAFKAAYYRQFPKNKFLKELIQEAEFARLNEIL